MAAGKHCSTSMPCCNSSAMGESRSRFKQAVLLTTAARSHAQGDARDLHRSLHTGACSCCLQQQRACRATPSCLM